MLDSLGVVVFAPSANALDFADLASAGGSLGDLEMNLGIGAEVADGTEVVVKSFESLEGLDLLDGAKNVGSTWSRSGGGFWPPTFHGDGQTIARL